MAEFCEVMWHWRRMCREFTRQGAEEAHGCVEIGCPLGHSHVCGEIELADGAEIAKAETDIMRWAAAHPEPVYPTWEEWLKSKGIIKVLGDDPYSRRIVPAFNMFACIPDDIAERLGLEPKEG